MPGQQGAFVTRLSTTAIKGLALEHPDEIELTAAGALGDRALFLVEASGRVFSVGRSGSLLGFRATYDPTARWLRLRSADGEEWAGEARTGKPVSTDFHGLRTVEGHVIEGPWSEVLSERVGRPLRLVRAAPAANGSDVHPVTLMGAKSLAALARHAGMGGFDGRRFRMLIEFDGAEPWAEDAWCGRSLSIGTAELVGGEPVLRCAATTCHPDTGARDTPTVKLLKELRGVVETSLGKGVPFGVYARVARRGKVRVGDEIRVSR